MINDKRKSARRPMRYTAWVAVQGEALRGCVLTDISDTGCKLDLEDAEKLPDHFLLLLSRRGFPKRRCRVAWRAPNQLGVEFDRKLAPAEIKSGAKPAAGSAAKQPSESGDADAEPTAQPQPA